MSKAEMKNAPPLYGWAIASAAGAVAFGASFVAVGIEGNGSVAIGVVVALIVGTVFTLAEREKPQARTRAPQPADTAPAPKPAPAVTAEAAAVPEGQRPKALGAAQGTADDLKQISGVGPVLEGKLNDLGIFHYWQIAEWTSEEVEWVDSFLNFKGRVDRDDWIAQAKTLAEATRAKS